METIKKSFFFFCFFIASACSKIEIDVKNDNFNTSNGVLYKNDKSYTGSLKTIQDTGIIIVEQYRDGRKNGVAKTFYSNGAPRSLERYTKNRLHGLQNSWWPDGSKKAKRSMPTVKEMEFIMNGIITDNLKGRCDTKKAFNMVIKKAGKRTVN